MRGREARRSRSVALWAPVRRPRSARFGAVPTAALPARVSESEPASGVQRKRGAAVSSGGPQAERSRPEARLSPGDARCLPCGRAKFPAGCRTRAAPIGRAAVFAPPFWSRFFAAAVCGPGSRLEGPGRGKSRRRRVLRLWDRRVRLRCRGIDEGLTESRA